MSKGYRVKVNGEYVDESSSSWESYEVPPLTTLTGRSSYRYIEDCLPKYYKRYATNTPYQRGPAPEKSNERFPQVDYDSLESRVWQDIIDLQLSKGIVPTRNPCLEIPWEASLHGDEEDDGM